MKRSLIFAAALALGIPVIWADDYVDDIYYNPKKDKTTTQTSVKKRSNNAYIVDFDQMDVDEYNRRGQYYSSPVDTIGRYTETAEDFVYTQQIQKFYNPTIVVDNADVLEDVLENSYGNVTIDLDINGYPVFSPLYAYNYWGPGYWGPGWSVSFGWGPSWGWGSSWGFNWGWSAGWGPSWGWGWGPGWDWAWGPSWGPSWGWGPAWGPSWGGGHWHPHYADYRRPGGRGPVGPNAGWATNTRPGYVANGMGSHRYQGTAGNYTRPGAAGNVGSGNGTGHYNSSVGQRDHHRQSGVDLRGGYTTSGSNRVSGNGSAGQSGVTVQSDGHRRSGNGVAGSGSSTTVNRNATTTGTHRQSGQSTTTNSNRSYNNNSNSNSNRSYNSNSNSNRSYNSNSGRSYNSGSSRSYGGGGGSHRSSGGGGGSRGTRR